MRPSTRRAALALATLLAAAATARAQPPATPPRPVHRWVWEALTAARLNPYGAIQRVETGYRLQIFRRPGRIFEETFLAAKLSTDLTPAFARAGLRIELQPLAVVALTAQIDAVGGFGTFNFGTSFRTPADEHDDSRLFRLAEGNVPHACLCLTLGAVLQGRAGPIGARSHLQALRQSMDLPGGDRVFYNPMLDILMEDEGWAVTNDLDVLVFVGDRWRFGTRYTVTHALYSDDLAVGAARENTPTHRLGPIAVWLLRRTEIGARWSEVGLIAFAQFWLAHRYRTGAETSALVPYFVVALQQKGDVVPF